MLGNFSFYCGPADFKINIFKKLFQEHYHRVGSHVVFA